MKNLLILILSMPFFAAIYANALKIDQNLTPREKMGKTTSLHIPFYFEKNVGQFDKTIDYVAKCKGYKVSISPQQISVLTNNRKPARVDFKFLGSNLNAEPEGKKLLSGKTNYFIGNDPAKWRTNVPIYSAVKISNIYKGIDIQLFERDQHLEYDLIVQPYADLNQIQIEINGAKDIEIDPNGNLFVETFSKDTLMQYIPKIYQVEKSNKQLIKGHFVKKAYNVIKFQIDNYDVSLPLVIDPYFVVFSSFLGGSELDNANSIEVDNEGNIYIGGETESEGLGTAGGFQPIKRDNRDGFIAKINPNGDALIYYTYIGGDHVDLINGISIDEDGNVYMIGATFSENLPINNAFQNTNGGSGDALIAKLNPAGTGLIFSTYLGGNDREEGFCIAIDTEENIYISGTTQSRNFPLRNALDGSLGGNEDYFVVKLMASGNQLVFSTYVGGNDTEYNPNDIKIDGSGDIYVVGKTASPDFPVTPNALQSTLSGPTDAFFIKIESNGTALLYGTFWGGSGNDSGDGICLDPENNVYLIGGTESVDFPTTPEVYQNTYGGGDGDTFVSKLGFENPENYNILLSTYFGSAEYDGDSDSDRKRIEVDNSENICIVSQSASNDLFVGISPLIPHASGTDGFLAVLNSDGSSLIFGTYLGGSGDGSNFDYDHTTDIAIDQYGAIYVTGYTHSSGFPIIPDNPSPLQSEYAGEIDAFFIKIAPIQTINARYEYAVKCVCGENPALNPANYRLVRGLYATTVNIHNPNDTTNRYFAKLALSFPPFQYAPGQIVPIGIISLLYDQAIQLDCDYLRRTLFPNGFLNGHIEGFVVIQSELPLDVVGVYTSGRRGRNDRIDQTGLEIEYIPERGINRSIPVTSDLAVSKSGRPNEQFDKANSITFNIRVTNNGAITAQNVTIQDILTIETPSTIFSSAPITNMVGGIWGINIISDNEIELNLDIGDIPPGVVRNFNFQLAILSHPENGQTQAVVHNIVNVTSSTPDSNITNNSATIQVVIDP